MVGCLEHYTTYLTLKLEHETLISGERPVINFIDDKAKMEDNYGGKAKIGKFNTKSMAKGSKHR